ncbi:MAG: tetratricopeptide repeat protein, partial [Nitrospinota bacterium]
MQKVKILTIVILAALFLPQAQTAQNNLFEVNMGSGPELSSITFSFDASVKYSVDTDYDKKIIKIFVPGSGFNPALEYKNFRDARVKGIVFSREGAAHLVAEISFSDIKTSIYHSLSKDGRNILLRLRSRKELMAVKTDIGKERAEIKKRKRDREIIKKLEAQASISGRKLYREAMEDFQKSLFVDAHKKLETFITKYPKSVYIEKAYFAKAEAMYRVSKKDGFYTGPAIEAFRLAMAQFPDSDRIPRGRLRIADLYLDQELYIEALVTYEGLVESHPKSKFALRALLGKAGVHLRRKEFNQAFNEFERILLLFPAAKEVRTARFKIAEAYFLKKDYETALMMFEDSDKRWPTYVRSHADSLKFFADSYFFMEKYDEALKRYSELANLFPDADEGKAAVNNIGDIYVELRRKKDALKVWGIQARSKPDDDFGLESRLRLAALGHEPVKIIDERKAVIWTYRDYFHPEETYNYIIENYMGTKHARNALYQKAKLLFQRKRYIESVFVIKDLFINYEPTRTWEPAVSLVRDNLFELVRKYHDQDGFLTVLSTYYENFDPFFANIKNPGILVKIADAYHELGLYPRALKKLATAQRHDKLNRYGDKIRFMKGRAYAAQKEYEKAREILLPFMDEFRSAKIPAEAIHLLGDMQYATGDNKKATMTFLKAIALDRKHRRVS